MIGELLLTLLVLSGVGELRLSSGAHQERMDGVPTYDSVGMHLEVQGVFETAREAVSSKPEEASAWWKLGALFDAHDLHRQAETCYRRAHELDPSDFRTIYLLAIVSDRLGHSLDVTVPLFDAAIELRGDFAPLYLNKGNALVRQGQEQAARDAYEQALEVDSLFFAAHRCLGQLLLITGELEQARTHLLSAWESAPQDSALNASLAQLYMRLGQRDVARDYADRARGAAPSLAYRDDVREEVMALTISIGARLQRARRAYNTQQFGLATMELEAILRLHPKQAEAHGMLGGILLRQDKLESALVHLEQAVALYPRDENKRLVLGRALITAGHNDPVALKSALQHLRFAAKLAPDDAEVREAFAEVLARRGRNDQAISNFERAAVGGRVLSEASYSLWGSSLAQAGRMQQAHECFRDAFEQLPESSLLCFNLAVSLEMLERSEEAITMYERAEAMGTNMPANERALDLKRKR